jgi:hypothetical protein
LVDILLISTDFLRIPATLGVVLSSLRQLWEFTKGLARKSAGPDEIPHHQTQLPYENFSVTRP